MKKYIVFKEMSYEHYKNPQLIFDIDNVLKVVEITSLSTIPDKSDCIIINNDKYVINFRIYDIDKPNDDIIIIVEKLNK